MGDRSELDRLAARQYGVFSTDQVRGFGFDRAAAHRRVADGEWIVVDDSVYALGSAPRTWQQQVVAAVLSRPAAVLTHLSAAHLLGVPGIGKSKPVILVPRGSNVRSSLARVVESDQFDAIAETTVHGIRVTTMPETVLIVARDVRGDRPEEIFDHTLIAGVLDLDCDVTGPGSGGRTTYTGRAPAQTSRRVAAALRPIALLYPAGALARASSRRQKGPAVAQGGGVPPRW